MSADYESFFDQIKKALAVVSCEAEARAALIKLLGPVRVVIVEHSDTHPDVFADRPIEVKSINYDVPGYVLDQACWIDQGDGTTAPAFVSYESPEDVPTVNKLWPNYNDSANEIDYRTRDEIPGGRFVSMDNLPPEMWGKENEMHPWEDTMHSIPIRIVEPQEPTGEEIARHLKWAIGDVDDDGHHD